MNQNVIMRQQNDAKKVNINELSEKFQSKHELYNFLSLDCKAFLPKMKSTNVYFYKQILKGEKNVSTFLYMFTNFST